MLYKDFKKATGSKLVEPVNLFFTEHNQDGYKSKPEFLDWISICTESQFNNVNDMFTFMRKKFKVTNRLTPKTDPKSGEDIIWVNFNLPNGTRNLPIPYDEGILRFLSDYQQAGLRFDADLDLLLAEAGFKLDESNSNL
ncbi:hypothetical protein [Pedobacter mendelii]|uniref:Uncharacterized protein n=1 Tax=Pedobacter mendelii TaxID=1908240 RepID=A0ABQ2BP02_9SPHI|nr:hypothetical protein [Pedobacter mendelii]GGI29052.1 hypothetical protein GCM10008119_35710 [Pedobacter mendelii]